MQDAGSQILRLANLVHWCHLMIWRRGWNSICLQTQFVCKQNHVVALQAILWRWDLKRAICGIWNWLWAMQRACVPCSQDRRCTHKTSKFKVCHVLSQGDSLEVACCWFWRSTLTCSPKLSAAELLAFRASWAERVKFKFFNQFDTQPSDFPLHSSSDQNEPDFKANKLSELRCQC